MNDKLFVSMMVAGDKLRIKNNGLSSKLIRRASVGVSLLAAALSLVFGISASSAEEKSTLYNLGESAAFARYCGHAGLVSKLRENYGGYRDFKKGLDRNLLPESYIWDVDCDDLKERVAKYFETVEVHAVKFPKGHPKAYITLDVEERNLIEKRVYNDLVDAISSEDATWDDQPEGGGNAPISSYKDFVQGRIYVKNLAACLTWDKETRTVGYLTWRAHVRRGWWRSKDFTLQQCLSARNQADLECSCRLIDHGGKSVLELPDHILSGYKRQMDEASSKSSVGAKSGG